MATYTVEQQVQQIYIGLLGRAADKPGLDYWTNEIETGVLSIEQLRANIVNEQPEYATGLGTLGRAQVVAELYQNLFERAAEPAGLEYWVNGGGSTVNIDQLVLALVNGAGAGDSLVLQNKTEAATYYTQQAGADFTRDAANAAVENVDSTRDSVDASKASTDAGTQTSGETFTLTAGVDEFAGTANNDTFKSGPVTADGTGATTLNSFDVINGGAGTDTLNITGSGTNNDSLVGDISNVEIINIDNRDVTTAQAVDASVGGAELEQLWQIGDAGNVTKLAGTSTAGLRGVDLSSAVDIEAADGANSVAVALDDVTGNTVSNVDTASLTVDGKNLGTVDVSGSIKLADGSTSSVLDLAVDVGVDAEGDALETVTVNSDQKTTLTLTTAGGVTAVNAAGSTGGITFDAGALTGIATINTGAGKDVIDIDTVTKKDIAATSTDETVDASVDTGAGDDQITATFSGDGKASVLAGEGKDTVTVAGLATGGTSVDAGAGDDTVDVSAVTLTTKDSVVGGEGADTLIITGGTSLVTADYLTLSAAASGFETLETNAATTIDASQVDSQFTALAFNAASTVNKLSDQALVLKGGASLAATTAGYKLDSDTSTAGNQTTYAGTVNATTYVDSTITANAANVNLAVVTKDSAMAAASADTSVTGTLTGDVQSATASLTSSRDTNAIGKSTGFENVAELAVDLDTVADNDVALNALTSITVTGAGTVTIDASDAVETTTQEAVSGKLTTIDLSGMEAFLNLDANGDQTDGTTVGTYENLSTTAVTLNDAVAETLKLGGADDTITTKSTFDEMDTIEGFELATDLATDPTGITADAAKSDSIDITGGAFTFEKFETTATTLQAALLEAGNAVDSSSAAIDDLAFNFGGNTYIYQDVGTAGISGDDTLVELTGTYDLDLLVDVIA